MFEKIDTVFEKINNTQKTIKHQPDMYLKNLKYLNNFRVFLEFC